MHPKVKHVFEKQNGYLILASEDDEAYYFKAQDIALIQSEGVDYTHLTYKTGPDTQEVYGFYIPSDVVFDCKVQAELTGGILDLRPACNCDLDNSRPSTKGKLMAKVTSYKPLAHG